MELTPYVEELRHQLLVAAEPGGDDARLVAERLSAALESATRLVLLDALSAAADAITVDLAPGSVDVRLRGLDPEFVVIPSEVDRFSDDREAGRADAVPIAGRPPVVDGEEGGTSRITLRLAEGLKVRIEEAAGREGISVNSWLARTVAAALDPAGAESRARSASPPGGQRFTGWVR
jgi:hypothetical protein